MTPLVSSRLPGLAARLVTVGLLVLTTGCKRENCTSVPTAESSQTAQGSPERLQDAGLDCERDAERRRPEGLQVATDGGRAEADFACLGRLLAPNTGSPAEFTMGAHAFAQTDNQGRPLAVPGLEVQLFDDNRIPDGSRCDTGCTRAEDLGDGTYRFLAAAEGWLAYRVLERSAGAMRPAVLRALEVNFVPAPGEAFNTVFEPVLDGLHQALDLPRDPQRTLLAGRLFDCNGRLVAGATIGLRDARGEKIASTPITRPIYLGPTGPDLSLAATTFTGQWSVTNAPVGTGTIVVEARADNGVVVACELAATAPDAMSVVRLRPLRRDAPAACTR
ncbi:MAG: hypothetical protein OXR73_04325 [Myxococcales bacterium]|nr:hypothetical protein [Myxococcales bacterium]